MYVYAFVFSNSNNSSNSNIKSTEKKEIKHHFHGCNFTKEKEGPNLDKISYISLKYHYP